jgi:hypothetical protein
MASGSAGNFAVFDMVVHGCCAVRRYDGTFVATRQP